MKIKQLVRIAAALLLVLGLCACSQGEGGEENMPTAFAFGPGEGNQGIQDWDVTSYENAYDAFFSSEEGAAGLSLASGDDVRYVRTVAVSPNSRYVLSALIKTQGVEGGRGANLSIDNYSIDQSCVYSDSLYGDNDWTPVSLYFETGDKQTEVILALRLGGYSENSTGTVYFKDVTLDKGLDSGATYQKLTSWGSGSEGDEEAREWDEQTYKSLFSAILWAAVLSAVVMVFCLYRNREEIESLDPADATYKGIFAAILAFGFVLRLALCLIFKGHDTDMNCFIAWGQSIAKDGPGTFYTAAGHEWYDYPPGYMLFLGGWSSVLNLLGVEVYGSFGRFLYMLPAIGADFGCAALLMRFAREQGGTKGKALLLGGLVYLNPALFFLSGAWGQIDSILTFFLILSFLLLYKEKRVWSGLVFGIAVSLKWQALMFGPAYALFHLFSLAPLGKTETLWKKLSGTLLGALAAFGAILLISLPFRGEQDFFWLINKFLSASSGYNYATVEAYNFMALAGGNWASADGALLGLPISYKTFGTVCILLAILLGGAAVAVQTRRETQKGGSLLHHKGHMFLTAALVMTLIFTFGHYMHERYIVPVLVLLLFAYAAYGDKRLLAVGMLLSSVTFLNEMNAMYVVSQAAMRIVRGSMEHNWIIHLCSLAEVGLCVYLVYLCVDIWFLSSEEKRTDSFLDSREWNEALEEVLNT